MGWPEAIKEIVGALRKLVPAIFLFFTGRRSGAEAVEKKVEKATDEVEKKQDEQDADFERRRRDPQFRDRVRDALKNADGE